VMVKFNSTNTTKVRNKMFHAVASNASRPCTGGYNKQLYANVAALWAEGCFRVSQTSEWSAPMHRIRCRCCCCRH
jgi:hypothetical protein